MKIIGMYLRMQIKGSQEKQSITRGHFTTTKQATYRFKMGLDSIEKPREGVA